MESNIKISDLKEIFYLKLNSELKFPYENTAKLIKRKWIEENGIPTAFRLKYITHRLSKISIIINIDPEAFLKRDDKNTITGINIDIPYGLSPSVYYKWVDRVKGLLLLSEKIGYENTFLTPYLRDSIIISARKVNDYVMNIKYDETYTAEINKNIDKLNTILLRHLENNTYEQFLSKYRKKACNSLKRKISLIRPGKDVIKTITNQFEDNIEEVITEKTRLLLISDIRKGKLI